MKRELCFRGVETPATILSALGLIEAPEVVRQIRLDYIAAGADIITTNTYGVIRRDLVMRKTMSYYSHSRCLPIALLSQSEHHEDQFPILFLRIK
jgi:S-methylmethionine-dependent homocysteine/selenocysteine methylase